VVGPQDRHCGRRWIHDGGLDSTRVEPSFGGLGAAHHTPDARLIGRNLLQLEQSQIDDRLPRAIEYARANSLNRIVQQGHRDRLGMVAAGKTYGLTMGFGHGESSLRSRMKFPTRTRPDYRPRERRPLRGNRRVKATKTS
jgi:hypothetical protein